MEGYELIQYFDNGEVYFEEGVRFQHRNKRTDKDFRLILTTEDGNEHIVDKALTWTEGHDDYILFDIGSAWPNSEDTAAYLVHEEIPIRVWVERGKGWT